MVGRTGQPVDLLVHVPVAQPIVEPIAPTLECFHPCPGARVGQIRFRLVAEIAAPHILVHLVKSIHRTAGSGRVFRSFTEY